MLDEGVRTAILEMQKRGTGTRAIAKALQVSRGAVRDVLREKTAAIPPSTRAQAPEPHHADILSLYGSCKGNLVRVYEELVTGGATFSYQTLTRFCRKHGIGYEPPEPAGRYEFGPGEEMQHDTSPHDVEVGGKMRRVQTASLVLCFSRWMFMQMYPRFTRFECKVFLADALGYFGGAAKRCMNDNTHVVVLSGTGRNMVPAPEMEAFGARYGFTFVAHALGDANRSARVERPFDFIDNNFLAGRRFTDWQDLNTRARQWCDKVNASFKRRLRTTPLALYTQERPHLVPLPRHVPEVYALHHRVVDVEGYVSVHSNRYSVPWKLIGRRMEVRETKDRIEVFDGPRRVCGHARVVDPCDQRVTLAEHRPPRGQRPAAVPSQDELALRNADGVIRDYADALRARHPDRAAAGLRALRRLVRDYPAVPLHTAVRAALEFGLFDLVRVERMVLRHVGAEFFNLNTNPEDDNDEDP